MSKARRPLQFDALETRELLSLAHAPREHHARERAHPAATSTSLPLDGVLTAHTNAKNETENNAGGVTSSVPVSGQLSSLGQVKGDWYESSGSTGYIGPDTITLHGAKGAIALAFNNGTPGPTHRAGPDSVFYQHPLKIQGGTGSYAGYMGTGTIDLNMNATHTEVESITINAEAKRRA